eukprot:1196081-Prorocentrum_minimum.AAC.5
MSEIQKIPGFTPKNTQKYPRTSRRAPTKHTNIRSSLAVGGCYSNRWYLTTPVTVPGSDTVPGRQLAGSARGWAGTSRAPRDARSGAGPWWPYPPRAGLASGARTVSQRVCASPPHRRERAPSALAKRSKRRGGGSLVK